MARKTTDSNGGVERSPLEQVSAGRPTTQRAYTLRLRPAVGHHASADQVQASKRRLSEALWSTHEAVNHGARIFGDWLLTLRGGISHELALPPDPRKAERSEEETAKIQRQRRILLALSWLSVEDEYGAPGGVFRVASGRDSDAVRREKVLSAFRAILAARGITRSDAASWEADCMDSLVARIREDAVWVNRSAQFDAAVLKVGDSLNREEVWDLLEPFFGDREAYLFAVNLDDEAEAGGDEKAKDLVQKAGQWLSSRFGEGKGADFAGMSKVYREISLWAATAPGFDSGPDALSALVGSLAEFKPRSDDADGILALISGPGYKSATRNLVKAWGARGGAVSREDLARLAETASADEAKARANIGGKGRRPWSDRLLAEVEGACGFSYLQQGGSARHSEFAVMLDHAARRVCIGHSWIKRAEGERQRFEERAAQLSSVPADAKEALDEFVRRRGESSGAVAAGGEYRIRPGAIAGWDEIVKRWRRSDCTTLERRVAAVREIQAEPEIEKFGDGQLFEALADDALKCVWHQTDGTSPHVLRDYVFGHDAREKQRRFKVPAYRHPDALLHPVFCDFGNSRWDIRYAIHEAAKFERKAAARATKGNRSAGAQAASDPEVAWRGDQHGLRMGLWDGSAQRAIDLRWASKRLCRDLGIGAEDRTAEAQTVTRADRLGRAAAGVKAEIGARARSLFALEDWNGRLQAPRQQLDAIAAHVERYGWDLKALQMRARIKWLVSFSAKLEPQGPFSDYIAASARGAEAVPFVSSKGEFGVKHQSNDARKGNAKLMLSRLPGLRVLGVDLGHRFAAACAVWTALSKGEFEQEVAGRSFIAGGMGNADLYLHTRDSNPRTGRERTTVYRRIAADRLADGAPHPAPWARLGRQFLIKLQGEDRPARKSAPGERQFVDRIERELGRVRSADDPIPERVDQLMAHAVRIARLGLLRLGDAARIAYAFHPNAARLTPGGGQEALSPEARVELVREALLRWGDLFNGSIWTDEWARNAWSEHIGCELVQVLPDASRHERKSQRAENEQRLESVAHELAASDTKALHSVWESRWREMDAGWRPRLRELRDWMLPRGLRANRSDSAVSAAHRASRRAAARRVGGLSLLRIATIRELYQLQKAYAMRPAPDNLRRNIAGKGDDRHDEFGRSVLQVMEKLREQRVKQIASRVVEAALGVGRLPTPRAKDRDRARPRAQIDLPCHAVVIENLRNYRPDELQTRRENRALMTWSAAKVRRHLEEGCQLHGLLLREVTPNYTSRQSSRTGLPGMRCVDLSVDPKTGRPDAIWWDKAIEQAERRIADGGGSAYDQMVVQLARALDETPPSGRTTARVVRLLRSGGDLFVEAPSWADIRAAQFGVRGAVQADLNAAANVGLRALLDADFLGRWWYVPCSSTTGQPERDRCLGAACIDLSKPLLELRARSSGAVKKSRDGREIVNAWRDPVAAAPATLDWKPHAPYWSDVAARLAEVLSRTNGITKIRP